MVFSVIEKQGQVCIQTSCMGKALLFHPLLNKGTAFTKSERVAFNLVGKLPPVVETIQQQAIRAYAQYSLLKTPQQQSIYLHTLFNTNEVLFYYLVCEYLSAVISVLYTPTVGSAVSNYSQEFRHPRGLYISYEDQDDIDTILSTQSNAEVDLIVVSDGEGVLGIGDQGIGGMGIPVAKLAMYIASGQCSPFRSFPLFLDVGTNNPSLLADPMYLGLRHKRIQGQEYLRFVDKVVAGIKRFFPKVVLHWEDFSKKNARRHLQTYQHELACFNDDIQGTGVVVLAAILTALRHKGEKLSQQRIVIVGAGSAGVGVANQLYSAALHYGLSVAEVKSLFWLIDRYGLVLDNHTHVGPDELKFARPAQECATWSDRQLADVVANVQPTILIGCSTVAGMFSQEILQTLCMHVQRPIIMPLSNPLQCAEATPEAIYAASQSKAFMATGSPFPAVKDERGFTVPVSQCNNLYAFPGIGAGMIAAHAKQLTEAMLIAAAEAIRDFILSQDLPDHCIMPRIEELRPVCDFVSKAVAEQAVGDKVAEFDLKQVNTRLKELAWRADYYPYSPKK